MGQKTKIQWCDSTWNPVTGCHHDCPYCYAERIAKRFRHKPGDRAFEDLFCVNVTEKDDGCGSCAECNHDLKEPYMFNGIINPYPYGFMPTFHEYKLDEPQRWNKPRTIFVCSMADLFGNWIPEEWIMKVFEACKAAPQHRYMFLTKNPKRYCELVNKKLLPRHQDNFWFGTTCDSKKSTHFTDGIRYKTFMSIEPLKEYMDMGFGSFGGDHWVIIGAETGNRKDKIVPKKEWIQNIVEAARITHMAVFMKESLRDIMGDDFIQEFPQDM